MPHLKLITAELVSRFRSSHHYAARSLANFGIKGTLAIYDSSAVFGFEVPTQTRGYNDRNFKSTALAGVLLRKRPSVAPSGLSFAGLTGLRGVVLVLHRARSNRRVYSAR